MSYRETTEKEFVTLNDLILIDQDPIASDETHCYTSTEENEFPFSSKKFKSGRGVVEQGWIILIKYSKPQPQNDYVKLWDKLAFRLVCGQNIFRTSLKGHKYA